MSEIARLREELEIERDNLIKIHRAAIREIDLSISELRKRCPHETVTWYPDPSGNNDSCEVCKICGAEAKRLKRKTE